MTLLVSVDFDSTTKKDILRLCKLYNLTTVDHRSAKVLHNYNVHFYYDNDYHLVVIDKHFLFYLLEINIPTSKFITVLLYHDQYYCHSYDLVIEFWRSDGTEKCWFIRIYQTREDESQGAEKIIRSLVRELYLEKCIVVMLVGNKYNLPSALEIEMTSYLRKFYK